MCVRERERERESSVAKVLLLSEQIDRTGEINKNVVLFVVCGLWFVSCLVSRLRLALRRSSWCGVAFVF